MLGLRLILEAGNPFLFVQLLGATTAGSGQLSAAITVADTVLLVGCLRGICLQRFVQHDPAVTHGYAISPPRALQRMLLPSTTLLAISWTAAALIRMVGIDSPALPLVLLPSTPIVGVQLAAALIVFALATLLSSRLALAPVVSLCERGGLWCLRRSWHLSCGAQRQAFGLMLTLDGPLAAMPVVPLVLGLFYRLLPEVPAALLGLARVPTVLLGAWALISIPLQAAATTALYRGLRAAREGSALDERIQAIVAAPAAGAGDEREQTAL